MSDVFCVTNRLLCKEDFLTRIEKLAKSKPCGIILREKDLSEDDYYLLAKDVMKICKAHGVLCVVHKFLDVAQRLGAKAIHLPLTSFRDMSKNELEALKSFDTIGASCHSVTDALDAQNFGCTYIIAGHVFETDCKRGVLPRGVDFIKDVVKSVNIPVYAIGGINHDNYSKTLEAGAEGVCVMSGAMLCEDVEEYMRGFDNEI